MPENNSPLNWSEKAQTLLEEQKQNWRLLRDNYENLANAQIRDLSLDGIEIRAQFNPARIISTSADVSTLGLNARKCFLCKENRPAEQIDLAYKNDFVILANPYPILTEHFTVASLAHTPQKFEGYALFFLELSKNLGGKYSIYYNGPRCGASAPDHLHFQAGTKNILPIEKDYEPIKKELGEIIYQTSEVKVFSYQNAYRNFISIESTSLESMDKIIQSTICSLKEILNTSEEPMINLISTYENKMWRIIIFLRETHRPKQYYFEGDSKILLSPAVIDLGGILITPRKDDFEKLSEPTVIDIFNQVTLNNVSYKMLIDRIKAF